MKKCPDYYLGDGGHRRFRLGVSSTWNENPAKISKKSVKNDTKGTTRPASETARASQEPTSFFSPVDKANEGENPDFDLRTVVLDSWTVSSSFFVVVLDLLPGFWFLTRVAGRIKYVPAFVVVDTRGIDNVMTRIQQK